MTPPAMKNRVPGTNDNHLILRKVLNFISVSAVGNDPQHSYGAGLDLNSNNLTKYTNTTTVRGGVISPLKPLMVL